MSVSDDPQRSTERRTPPRTTTMTLSDHEAGRRRETADYIADMLTELAIMARKDRHDLLAYFLDMARIEAREMARRDKP